MRVFTEAIVFVLLWTAFCAAKDPRAEAAVAVSISRVAVAVSRPALPNDFQTRTRQTQTPTPIIDHAEAAELQKLMSEQSQEIVDLERELAGANAERKELRDTAGKLLAEVIDLKGKADAMPPIEAAPFGELRLDLTKPVAAGPETDNRYRVIVGISRSCIHCPGLKRRVGSGDELTAVEYVDVEQPRPADVPIAWWQFIQQHLNSGVPMVTWIDGAGQFRRLHDGSLTLNQIRLSIEAPFNSPPPQARFNAPRSGAGGRIKTGGRIAALLRAWQDRLGPDAELSLRVDRNGPQKLSVTKLMHGEPWHAQEVCGTFGHVALSTTSTRLPGGVRDLGFTYRTLDDGRFSFDADPFVLKLPGTEAQHNSQAVGAVGVDPVSLGLTILQVASALYQILNPQVDVGLGGSVALKAKLDGDKVVCTFSDCPSIHVAAWFRFDLDVQRVEATTSNIHVAFKPQPQNWIKVDSRDFAVDDN